MKYVKVTIEAIVRLPESTDLDDLMISNNVSACNIQAYSNGGCKIVRVAGVDETHCSWEEIPNPHQSVFA